MTGFRRFITNVRSLGETSRLRNLYNQEREATSYANKEHFEGNHKNGKTQLNPHDERIKEMDKHAKFFGDFWRRNSSKNWNYLSNQEKIKFFDNNNFHQGQYGKTALKNIAPSSGLPIFHYISDDPISVTTNGVQQYTSEIKFGADLKKNPSEGFAHFHGMATPSDVKIWGPTGKPWSMIK